MLAFQLELARLEVVEHFLGFDLVVLSLLLVRPDRRCHDLVVRDAHSGPVLLRESGTLEDLLALCSRVFGVGAVLPVFDLRTLHISAFVRLVSAPLELFPFVDALVEPLRGILGICQIFECPKVDDCFVSVSVHRLILSNEAVEDLGRLPREILQAHSIIYDILSNALRVIGCDDHGDEHFELGLLFPLIVSYVPRRLHRRRVFHDQGPAVRGKFRTGSSLLVLLQLGRVVRRRRLIAVVRVEGATHAGCHERQSGET